VGDVFGAGIAQALTPELIKRLVHLGRVWTLDGSQMALEPWKWRLQRVVFMRHDLRKGHDGWYFENEHANIAASTDTFDERAPLVSGGSSYETYAFVRQSSQIESYGEAEVGTLARVHEVPQGQKSRVRKKPLGPMQPVDLDLLKERALGNRGKLQTMQFPTPKQVFGSFAVALDTALMRQLFNKPVWILVQALDARSWTLTRMEFKPERLHKEWEYWTYDTTGRNGMHTSGSSELHYFGYSSNFHPMYALVRPAKADQHARDQDQAAGAARYDGPTTVALKDLVGLKDAPRTRAKKA